MFKVASTPDVRCMIVQKRRPVLSPWSWCADGSHVLLNGSLADVYAEFQEFPTDTFSSPESILRRHFPDQGDGFGSDLRRMRSGL